VEHLALAVKQVGALVVPVVQGGLHFRERAIVPSEPRPRGVRLYDFICKSPVAWPEVRYASLQEAVALHGPDDGGWFGT
jgi:hypothetical protein